MFVATFELSFSPRRPLSARRRRFQRLASPCPLGRTAFALRSKNPCRAAALGRLDRTLVLVYSEFGRRVAQNGVRDKAGTDHGAAGLAMMLGNGIRAGIHGARPSLDALDDHGNLPHTTDFRAVYADAIAGWFGLDAEAVLGGDFGRAGLVRA